MKKGSLAIFVLLACLVCCESGIAQTIAVAAGNTRQSSGGPDKVFYQADSNAPDKWRYFLEPYLMFPNMHGKVGLGNLPDAAVDENPSDIFNNLQIGVMFYGEAYSNFWVITSDLTYMKLAADAQSQHGILFGNVEVKQTMWELAMMRKLKPWLEAGLAMQLNNISSKLDLVINGSGGNRNLSETWVDPSLVVRLKWPVNRWLFQFRGNAGGFGIGSDFYWQTQAYAGYRFSKVFVLSAGYRIVGFDYEKGSDSERFLYDMNTFGGVIRLGFNF